MKQPYDERDQPGEISLAEALTVPCQQIYALANEILADIATERPYGVRWWAPDPGTSRRILISDHLYSCAISVMTNMVEAALHRLEFLDHIDRENDHLAESVRLVNGEPTIQLRRRRHAFDDSIGTLVDLHAIGVVRALSGALDCLGAAMVGVLALSVNILKSDLDKARNVIRGIRQPNTEGARRQLDFGAQLDAVIADAGPPGWLEWLIAYRNMLIHRGRRLAVGQFVARPVILDARGTRLPPRADVIRHLPRDAARSDIEVLLDRNQPPVLTESATVTVEGILHSTHTVVERTAAMLLEAWRWRRMRPEALRQPRAQWPDRPALQREVFRGYAEGSAPYNPTLLTGHPVLIHRMRGASLPDDVRENWRTFD